MHYILSKKIAEVPSTTIVRNYYTYAADIKALWLAVENYEILI